MIAPVVFEPGAALAQQQVDEIIVTAQRREQAIIDVPVSVSVVSVKDVETKNLSSFTSVADFTPNFNITQSRGGNTVPNLTIRGIRGDSNNGRINESSVAVYVDDIYMGDESMLSGQMFDVERVEVLRGPQGTLFGRNTTGGLVQFVSAAPQDHFTAKASALYGSDDWVSFNGAISVPLNEKVRTRLAGQYESHDGHFNNRADPAFVNRPLDPLGAKKVWGIRSTTDMDFTDNVTLRVQYTHSEIDSQSTPGYGLGIWEPGTNPALPLAQKPICSRKDILAAKCYDIFALNGVEPQSGRRAGDAITEQNADDLRVASNLDSITAKFQFDFGAASLISITNYTDFKSQMGVDADAATTPSALDTNLNVTFFNTAEQFSQELRLQGSTSAFDWVAGLFYYQDEKTSQSVVRLTRPRVLNYAAFGKVDTHSTAVFGQVDYHLNDQLTLAAGARYTWENRELKAASLNFVGVGIQDVLSGVSDPDPHTKDLTGKVSLTWEATADNTLYASYSRGAKSVGYNVFYGLGGFGNSGNADQTGPVGQEHLDAFEIGSKNRFFGRTLMLNAAVFYYLFDGKQEQLSIVDNSSGTPVVLSKYINVGKAELYGGELELAYTPNENWDFRFGAGLLHTKITDSDVVVSDPLLGAVPLQGLPIPQAPKWNVSGVLAYHIPTASAGRFTLQGEINAQGKQNFDLSHNYLATAPAREITNLRILWESAEGHYNAQVFVTNVFNEAYFNSIYGVNTAQGSLTTQQAEPRVWGVKFGVSF